MYIEPFVRDEGFAVLTGSVEKARTKYYEHLVDHFLAHLDAGRVQSMLEAGCGKGQLTIPLLDRLPRAVSLVAVDSSRDSYAGSLQVLSTRLNSGKYPRRIRIVQSDVRKIRNVRSESVDVVVSNELLCDFKSETDVMRAFKEFYRVLRPGGVMVHGEWASQPTNTAQAITIRADSPGATSSPSRFWNPDELFELNSKADFDSLSVSYFQETISFRYEAAIQELRSWGVRESFLRKNDGLLRRHGIQLPFEHLVRSRKGRR